jgi:hypothetical protein
MSAFADAVAMLHPVADATARPLPGITRAQPHRNHPPGIEACAAQQGGRMNSRLGKRNVRLRGRVGHAPSGGRSNCASSTGNHPVTTAPESPARDRGMRGATGGRMNSRLGKRNVRLRGRVGHAPSGGRSTCAPATGNHPIATAPESPARDSPRPERPSRTPHSALPTLRTRGRPGNVPPGATRGRRRPLPAGGGSRLR